MNPKAIGFVKVDLFQIEIHPQVLLATPHFIIILSICAAGERWTEKGGRKRVQNKEIGRRHSKFSMASKIKREKIQT